MTSAALKHMTRESVDQAQPLEFVPAPPPAAPRALVTVSFQGVPVQLDILSMDSQTLAHIEKLIARLLERDGWGKVATPQASNSGRAYPPKKKQDPPSWDGQGNPCCPIHGRKLRGPNQWGKHFCSAKDGDEYCKYTTVIE